MSRSVVVVPRPPCVCAKFDELRCPCVVTVLSLRTLLPPAARLELEIRAPRLPPCSDARALTRAFALALDCAVVERSEPGTTPWCAKPAERRYCAFAFAGERFISGARLGEVPLTRALATAAARSERCPVLRAAISGSRLLTTRTLLLPAAVARALPGRRAASTAPGAGRTTVSERVDDWPRSPAG